MEFLDEYESKPRFLFQSRNLPRPHEILPPSSSSYLSSLHRPTLFISLSFSLLIFAVALIYFNFEPLQSLLLWLSISLLIGPFAPPSLTAGDIRVGVGPPLEEISLAPLESNEKPSRKSTKSIRKDTEGNSNSNLQRSNGIDVDLVKKKQQSDQLDPTVPVMEVKEEWGEGDDELLKKMMGKHPVGKPGRWEAITEGFKGKHKVETVIAKAKQIGEKKGGDQDSYNKFLKDRKAVDTRGYVDEESNKSNTYVEEGTGKNVSGWSAAEDLALLNALKAFPKEVPMRWEKVSSSLPGKTKAACIKRVADLKKDFRTSKSSSAAQPC